MDGDPAVESALDSFSLTFPLPYRVAFIIILAIWAWGVNLQCLTICKVDVPSLIRYPQRRSPTEVAHHLSTYRLATVLSGTFAVSICIFWLFSHHDPELVVYYDWMPMLYLLFLVASFFTPLKNLSHSGRTRFLHTLRRVSLGGIAESKDGKFGDIILADVLTSYAKILADLFITLCMFFFDGAEGSATARPDRGCGGQVLVPLVMAVPSAIRLRQCLIEYGRAQRSRSVRDGWGGQHLANAAKYASAFPVIILSALQRSSDGIVGGEGVALYRAWVVAVLVNSLYSFYWDVAKDWDLTLLSSTLERENPSHPYGLRQIMVFRPAMIYYIAIGMDLALRCTWSLKLSPHLDRMADWEGGIFTLQFLEVFRRWVWIFFRVEAEWIRGQSSGLADDDILLGDFSGADNDDEEF
ncbi:protein-ER retention protein [Zalerion maritima]|uniref:Protein-ER retention protein n=1 Tax=Zalerion maritima TaxID=339359 RepID=A0AAD5RP69_9PEZI|nr:protein-ER retention protein [Zalerion maritima]